MTDELTLDEAATELGRSRSTLWNQLRFGKFHGTKRAGVWLFTRQEVERYRSEHLRRESK